jgi:hypothetical protein
MATAQEREVAAWIALLVEQLWGIEVGPATERDGRDDSGLTNDFTYEEADPRIAVEVTRLRDDFETPSPEELNALRDRLQGFVDKKGWPHWTVGVRPETQFKSELEPTARRIIEWMIAADVDTLGPGTYTSDVSADLIHRMGEGLMRDCEAARLAGVVLILRNKTGGLRVIPIAEFSDSRSLQRPLARTFAKKTASLGRAKKLRYVTMLAVDVEREDASGYLAGDVKAPGFPIVLDHLWVVVRERSKIFHATREDRRFQVFHLMGEGPRADVGVRAEHTRTGGLVPSRDRRLPHGACHSARCGLWEACRGGRFAFPGPPFSTLHTNYPHLNRSGDLAAL